MAHMKNWKVCLEGFGSLERDLPPITWCWEGSHSRVVASVALALKGWPWDSVSTNQPSTHWPRWPQPSTQWPRWPGKGANVALGMEESPAGCWKLRWVTNPGGALKRRHAGKLVSRHRSHWIADFQNSTIPGEGRCWCQEAEYLCVNTATFPWLCACLAGALAIQPECFRLAVESSQHKTWNAEPRSLTKWSLPYVNGKREEPKRLPPALLKWWPQTTLSPPPQPHSQGQQGQRGPW